MSLYTDYLAQIETRKGEGLHPKPIEDAELVEELMAQILDQNHEHRAESLNFFIYNTLPGTTSAAGVKAQFLKKVILGTAVVGEISQGFAFELLSHMKGGPSVEVLLDLVLGDDETVANSAAEVLKTQVFLYEADTDRLEQAHNSGHALATAILRSYAKAEFFTKLPPVDETIQVVTYVTAIGDVSTDLLSPGSDAHSRSDRELHGQCLFEHKLNLRTS
jgi:aconitate hydratase 2/2-methylisocitrate dehydratase